jgi:VWFA-related protein
MYAGCIRRKQLVAAYENLSAWREKWNYRLLWEESLPSGSYRCPSDSYAEREMHRSGLVGGRGAWLLAMVVAFALPGGVRGQQQPTQPVQSGQASQTSQSGQSQSGTSQTSAPIAVDVKVVNVLATVRDKHDKIVSELGEDDFVLTEDGKPQQITYFSRETDVPLTLGLLLDTSGSQRNVLDQERMASHSFLDDMLREDKDKAFVIHFDRQVELLQDLTASREKLASAIELIEPERPQFGQTNGTGSGGNGGGDGGYGGRGGQRAGGAGTLLYDAVFLASDEVIKKQQGRKALIVLSDGVDRGSQETLETAIMTAQRADTVIYAIYFSGEDSFQSPFGHGGGFGGRGGGMGRGGGGRFPQEERPDGKKVLERISKETGGRMFEVSKKEPIDQVFSAIEEDLRNQYSIGYTPASDVQPGYHKLQLTTKQKDMTVQARDGYYTEH